VTAFDWTPLIPLVPFSPNLFSTFVQEIPAICQPGISMKRGAASLTFKVFLGRFGGHPTLDGFSFNDSILKLETVYFGVLTSLTIFFSLLRKIWETAEADTPICRTIPAKGTPSSCTSIRAESDRTLADVVQRSPRIHPGPLYYHPSANLFKLGIRKSQKARPRNLE
jgi:hypothetical protein